MIVVAHLHLESVTELELSFDGRAWTGPLPQALLSILNERAAIESTQHYSAYDVADIVLGQLFPKLYRLEVTEQDELQELPAGAIA